MKHDARKFLLPIGIASVCFTQTLSAQGDDYSKNNQFGILGEAVIMIRSRGDEEILVLDAKPTTIKPQDMDTKDIRHRFEYEPGYRIGINYILDAKNYFEANFLWVNEWSGRKTSANQGALSFAFDEPEETTDYFQADIARGHYESNFYSTEANFWRSIKPRNANYFAFSAIVGIRYLNLRENFLMKFSKATDTSDYRINTKNHLVGGQFGADLQWNPTTTLSWDFYLKVGGFFNLAHQNSLLKDKNNTVTLLKSKASSTKGSVLLDGGLVIGYQIVNHINLHLGYEFIYIIGVANAPGQIQHRTIAADDVRLNAQGTALISGAYAGLNIGF